AARVILFCCKQSLFPRRLTVTGVFTFRCTRSMAGTSSRHSGVVFAPDGGPKLRSKEMGLVFELAFCRVRLPGCVGKRGRRAGVVSGRPRGVARRQRRDV